ncbi:inner arm dynein, group 5 [Planoprotostelium fungivorum]|uniref:Inner arm dynein, group 5 n=1 Tax=Planoprotostelium fungivorum TaxID=1890364 RepID=A0A2P6NZJ5_9EUKA|nr:inner arm dynein, group 5 [Planoprotostelium fungivorum]
MSEKKPLDENDFHAKSNTRSLKHGSNYAVKKRKASYAHSTKPKALDVNLPDYYSYPNSEDYQREQEPGIIAVNNRFTQTRQNQRHFISSSTVADTHHGSFDFSELEMMQTGNTDVSFAEDTGTRYKTSPQIPPLQTDWLRPTTSLRATFSPTRAHEVMASADVRPSMRGVLTSHKETRPITSNQTDTIFDSLAAPEEKQEVDMPKEDPVSFFAKNKMGPVKFVYLNQVKNVAHPNPYTLEIVQPNEVDKDYYTMSSNGVTFIRSDGHTEFTSMAHWVRESEVYEIVSRLEVFRNYRYWKSFKKWRSYIRKRRLKANKIKLENSLFCLKPIFGKAELNLVKICEAELLKMELLPVKLHASYTVSDFNSNFLGGSNSNRRTIKQQSTDFIESIIEDINQLISEVSDPERVKIVSDDFKIRARRKISLRQLMLLEKQKALEQARITHQVNAEITMIGSFIRLCDYIIIQYLVKLILSEFSRFLIILQTDKANIFHTSVVFDEKGDISFSPNSETVESLVMEVIRDTISLLNNLPRVLYHPNFEKYLEESRHRVTNPADGPSVQQFLNQVTEYDRIIVQIREVIQNSFQSAKAYAKNFGEFKSVYLFGREWSMDKYPKKPTLEQFSGDLARFNKWSTDMTRMQTSSTRGLLFVDSKQLKSVLTPIPQNAVEDLKQLLLSNASENTSNLLDLFRRSIHSLAAEPSTLDEFVDFVRILNPLSSEIGPYTEEIMQIDEMYALLDETDAIIPHSDLEKRSLIHTVFNRFRDSLTAADMLKQRMMPEYIKLLEQCIVDANDNLTVINGRLDAQTFQDPRSMPESLLVDLADINVQVTELRDRFDRFTSYQVTFDLPKNNGLEYVGFTMNKLHRTEELWSTVHKWQQMENIYATIPFTSLKKEDIANDLNSVYNKATGILNINSESQVARSMLDKIEQYQKILGHILALANPAIKTEHWAQLFSAVGQPYDKETTFTLTQLRDYNIINHGEIISEISTIATGEYNLETTFENIEKTWSSQNFTLSKYQNKSKSALAITNMDDIQKMLEDHEISLAALLNSEYKMEILKNKLSHVSDVLDEWAACQDRWFSLEPVFAQYEVQKQLPNQTTKFRVIDRRFRSIMRNTQKEPNVMISVGQSGLMSNLIESNMVMESIMASLDSHVEAKRSAYNRFYLLSNAEIFSLNSLVHDANMVQPLVKKMFSGIRGLDFTSPQCDEIGGLLGDSGEKLNFGKGIKTEGPMETWIKSVEEKSLQSAVPKAMAEFSRMPFEQWINLFPSQIIVAVLQISFTRKVYLALEGNNPREGITQMESILSKRISVVAEMIRRERENPEKSPSPVLGMVLNADSHCLEIVKRLIQNRVSHSTDVEWTRHVHHFWDEKKKRIFLRCSQLYNSSLGVSGNSPLPQGVFVYGYEFIGIGNRLVYNSTVQRTTLGMTDALSQRSGVMLFGEQCTGRSEMVKDLAKIFGRFHMSVGTASALSYPTFLRLLTGAVQIGAWLTLEDILTLSNPQQSLLSVFLHSLQLAISERADTFTFDGKSITPDDHFNLFVTMTTRSTPQEWGNGGGNVALPDHLRRFFRPIGVASPTSDDVIGLSDIGLTSGGYVNGEILAKRISRTFQLIRNTAVQGKGYDFSLRKLKQVLQRCNMRLVVEAQTEGIVPSPERIFTEECENVSASLWDVLSPQMSSPDASTFNSLLIDIFPNQSKTISARLISGRQQRDVQVITEHLKSTGLVSSPSFIEKILRLSDLMTHNRLVVVTGRYGKTSVIKVLASCISKLVTMVTPQLVETETGLSIDTTLGYFSKEGESEWVYGLLTRAINRDALSVHGSPEEEEGQNVPRREDWLLLRTSLEQSHPFWFKAIESLSEETAASLVLDNNERLTLPPTTRIIIEADDLQHVSPATIARAAILRMDDDDVTPEMYWSFWSQGYFREQSRLDKPEHKSHLDALFHEHFSRAIRIAREEYTHSYKLTPLHVTRSLCAVIESVLHQILTQAMVSKDVDSGCRLLNIAFGLGMVWSVGGHLAEEDRKSFEAFCRRHLEGLLDKSGTLLDRSFYDLYLAQNSSLQGYRKPATEFTAPAVGFNAGDPPHATSGPVVTVELMRYSGFISNLFERQHHAVLVGPSGCGKSTIVEHLVQNDSFSNLQFTIGADTTAEELRFRLESQFEFYRKNILAPPGGKKMILCGQIGVADPPSPSACDFLQRLIQTRTYLDPVKLQPVKLVLHVRSFDDLSALPQRFLENLQIIHVPAIQETAMHSIITPIIKNSILPFGSAELIRMVQPMSEALLSMFKHLRHRFITEDRDPYYRHLLHMHSLCRTLGSIHKLGLVTPSSLIRMWKHEITRVFCDPLDNEADRNWFNETLDDLFRRVFVAGDLEESDKNESFFLDLPARHHPGSTQGNGAILQYEPDDLTNIVEKSLEAGRLTLEEKFLPTENLMVTVAKIVRLIKRPQGHLIQLTTPGSGTTSAIKIAGWLADVQIIHLQLTSSYSIDNFCADIKPIMMRVGVESRHVAVVMTETARGDDRIYQMLEHLIQYGDVPSLFDRDEEDKIVADMRVRTMSASLPSEGEGVYARFIKNIRFHLHFILPMDFRGERFRGAVRSASPLFSTCHIDRMEPWNNSNLLVLSKKLCADAKINVPSSPIMVDRVSHLVAQIHHIACKSSPVHLPANRLLENITLIERMYHKRHSEIEIQIESVKMAVRKMSSVVTLADSIRIEMQTLHPLLQKVTEDTKRLEESINHNSKIVEEFWKVIHQEQISVNVKNAEMVELIEDAKKAQEEFDKVVPVLNAAIAGVRSITKNDTNELRTHFPNPPEKIQKVMEAALIMQGKEPSQTNMLNMVNSPLVWMINFDKENVSEDILKTIKKYIINPEFNPSGVENKAAKFFCSWIIAIYKFANVFKLVQPRRARVATADGQMKDIRTALEEKQLRMTEAEMKLEEYKAFHKTTNEKRSLLDNKSNELSLQLRRAEKILESLEGQEAEWNHRVNQKEAEVSLLMGNTVLISSATTYLGSFPPQLRQPVISQWIESCRSSQVPISDNFNLDAVVSPHDMTEWFRCGLPDDAASRQNVEIINRNMRWPFIIDPAGVAVRWIKAREKGNQVKIVDPTRPGFLRTIETLVVAGRPVIVENPWKTLHPDVETLIVTYNLTRRRKTVVVDFGGKPVQYSESFRLYIITPCHNHQLSDEITNRLNVVDFSLSFHGLIDHLLNHVLRTERPEIQQQKDTLMERKNTDDNERKDIENKMVDLVSNAEGSMAETDLLVNELHVARNNLTIILKRMENNYELEEKCEAIRSQYRPIALRGAVLFQVLKDFHHLQPVMEFDVALLVSILKSTLTKCTVNHKLQIRVNAICKDLTSNCFVSVGGGLNSKRKITLAFTMAVRVAIQTEQADEDDFRFFLDIRNFPVKQVPEDRPPNEVWVTENLWNNVTRLERRIGGFAEQFIQSLPQWKLFLDPEAGTTVGRELPNGLDTKLSRPFQALTDGSYLLHEMMEFATKQLGPNFMVPISINVDKVNNSSTLIPIPTIFLNSGQANFSMPATLIRYAAQHNMKEKLSVLTMGDRRGIPEVEKKISEAISEGKWVILQDAHRSSEWLSSLNQLLSPSATTEQGVHNDFKLWITTETTEDFPAQILRRSVRYNTECPNSVRAGLVALFKDPIDSALAGCRKPSQLRRILFSLNLFQSLLWTRSSMGRLGFSDVLPTDNADHFLVMERVKNLLNASEERSEEIPWKTMHTIFSEVYYGGHLTDPHDRQILSAMLMDHLNPNIMEDKWTFGQQNENYILNGEAITDSYVMRLPQIDSPDVTGLSKNLAPLWHKELVHSMREDMKKLTEGYYKAIGSLINAITLDRRSIYRALIRSIPRTELDIGDYSPTGREKHCLSQEVSILKRVRQIVLSDLHSHFSRSSDPHDPPTETSDHILRNSVPPSWKLWPSCLPLHRWMEDLIARFKFYNDWMQNGTPQALWMGAIVYPQLLFFKLRHDFARENRMEAEEVYLEFEPHHERRNNNDDGNSLVLSGLHLLGARYNSSTNKLEELASDTSPLQPLPKMICRATRKPNPSNNISCPLYRSIVRGQKNWIATVQLSSDQSERQWLRRGVIMVTHADAEMTVSTCDEPSNPAN